MKDLKILVDVSAIDKIYQGTAVYIFELYKAINQLQPNISLFFISNNREKQEEYFSSFTNVTFLQFKSSNKLIQLYLEMPKFLKQIEPDFAHFQYVIPIKTKVKYIVTIHDLLIFTHPHFFKIQFRIVRKFLYRYAIKNSDLVLSVSNFTSCALQSNFKNINIVKTPNAVDYNSLDIKNPQFAKQYIAEKYGINKFILFVSRREKRKNHQLLYDMFYELGLDKQSYSLVFIGSGVESFFKSSVTKSFFPLEDIPSKDLNLFYQAAELFIYPSLAEGFGIPPLEALAAGTKVLCSNKTALQEFSFFDDRLFDPENRPAMKSKILNALRYYPEKEISIQRKQAMAQYSWKRSAQLFLDALNLY